LDQRKKTREVRKYIEMNDESTTYHNLWGAAKAVLREKFIVVKCQS